MANRKPISRDTMFKSIIRDGGVCQNCKKNLIGAESPDLSSRAEFHHIRPVSEGGDDSLENIVTLCHACHMKEHGYDPDSRTPGIPRGSDYHVTGDKLNGFRVTVPMSVKPKAGDRYCLIPSNEIFPGMVLPAGSLVYVPAPRPTSKREKKGVSG
jgi:hypothetical protein